MLFSSQNSKHPQTPFELAGLAVGRQMKLAELTARTMFEAPFEQMRLMQKIGTMQLQILSPLARAEEEAPKTPAATPAKADVKPAAANPTVKRAAPKTTAKKAPVRKAAPKPATPTKAPVRTRRATPAKPAVTPTAKAPESTAPIAAAKPANTPKPTTTVTKPATAVKPKAPAKKD